MHPALLIPMLPLAGGVLIALTAILTSQWRKHRQTELEMSLKHEMLNRGFSAEEIERVVKASKSKS
jgi:SOS response regulatory protein OraA/RecX